MKDIRQHMTNAPPFIVITRLVRVIYKEMDHMHKACDDKFI